MLGILQPKKSLAFFKGFGCKKIAAQEFREWSHTTLLGLAVSSLATVDRTENGVLVTERSEVACYNNNKQ